MTFQPVLGIFQETFVNLYPCACHLQWYSVRVWQFLESWTWAAAGSLCLALCVRLYVLKDGHSMGRQLWRVMRQDTGLGCRPPVKVKHWLGLAVWGTRQRRGKYRTIHYAQTRKFPRLRSWWIFNFMAVGRKQKRWHVDGTGSILNGKRGARDPSREKEDK